MPTKPESQTAKAGFPKDRKIRKTVNETARLFIHVDEIRRRPAAAPLTRYVE